MLYRSRHRDRGPTLAQQIEKPILVEGPAGVGKNRACESQSQGWLGLKMIRLQCSQDGRGEGALRVDYASTFFTPRS